MVRAVEAESTIDEREGRSVRTFHLGTEKTAPLSTADLTSDAILGRVYSILRRTHMLNSTIPVVCLRSMIAQSQSVARVLPNGNGAFESDFEELAGAVVRGEVSAHGFDRSPPLN